jgi:hypothetical protein
LKKALKIIGIIVGILLAIVRRERGVERLCLSTPISGAFRPTGATSGASLQDAEKS